MAFLLKMKRYWVKEKSAVNAPVLLSPLIRTAEDQKDKYRKYYHFLISLGNEQTRKCCKYLVLIFQNICTFIRAGHSLFFSGSLSAQFCFHGSLSLKHSFFGFPSLLIAQLLLIKNSGLLLLSSLNHS